MLQLFTSSSENIIIIVSRKNRFFSWTMDIGCIRERVDLSKIQKI
jgi:hypothetical protein